MSEQKIASGEECGQIVYWLDHEVSDQLSRDLIAKEWDALGDSGQTIFVRLALMPSDDSRDIPVDDLKTKRGYGEFSFRQSMDSAKTKKLMRFREVKGKEYVSLARSVIQFVVEHHDIPYIPPRMEYLEI